MRTLRTLALALAAGLGLLWAQEARAASVTFSDPAPSGSPFYADFTADAGLADQFTFCVELDEGFSMGVAYNYTVDTYVAFQDAAHGADANGRDYLSSQTAYLFTLFANNTLASTLGLAYSASALQDAIWYLEQDLTNFGALGILAQDYVIAAQDAVAEGQWSGLGNVRVLNLTQNGNDKQSQLIVVPPPTGVPEPASMLLAGLGLATLAMRRRARS